MNWSLILPGVLPMLEFFDKFPYFGANLLLLPVVLGGILVVRAQRTYAILSGLLLAPFAFASLFYVPRYWDPVRLGTILRTGPEDLLLSFGTGVLIWAMAFGLCRVEVGAARSPSMAILRYVCIAVVGVAIAVGLKYFGLPPGPAALVSITVTGFWLLTKNPFLWPQALAGGTGFAAVYQVFLIVSFRFWPHFLDQWNLEKFCGISVAKVPIEETAWAFTTGVTWTLFMAYTLSIRIRRDDASS